MPPPVAVMLGVVAGVGGFVSAIALLLRDAPLAASMAALPNALDKILAFFQAACESSGGRFVLEPLVGMLLVFNALFGLEARRAR